MLEQKLETMLFSSFTRRNKIIRGDISINFIQMKH